MACLYGYCILIQRRQVRLCVNGLISIERYSRVAKAVYLLPSGPSFRHP